MLESLSGTALDLLSRYGYVALFVFLFLETSMLFPLLPSEVVVPAGAALLVRGPATFVLFVASGTAGGIVGSLVLYRASASGGRYADRVRLSEGERRRAQRWFERWGEGAVLWGRLLPGIRSIISVPAGLAGMDRRRFVVYTAIGTAGFTALVAALVRAGLDARSPSGLLSRAAAVAAERPALVVALVLVVAAVAVLVARRRA